MILVGHFTDEGVLNHQVMWEAQQLQASGVIEQHERLDCDEDRWWILVDQFNVDTVIANSSNQIQSVTLRSLKSFSQLENFDLGTN